MQDKNELFKKGNKNQFTNVDLTGYKVGFPGLISDYETINKIVANTQADFRLINGQMCLSKRQLAAVCDVSVETIAEHIANIYGKRLEDNKPLINGYMIYQVNTAVNQRFYGGGGVTPPTTIDLNECKFQYKVVDYFSHYILVELAFKIRNCNGELIRNEIQEVAQTYRRYGFSIDMDFLQDKSNSGNLVMLGEAYRNLLPARISEINSFSRLKDVIYELSSDSNMLPNNISGKLDGCLQNILMVASMGLGAAGIKQKYCNKNQPNCGLHSFRGVNPTLNDIQIAKNYMPAVYLNYMESLNEHLIHKLPWYVHQSNLTGKVSRQDINRICHLLSFTPGGNIVDYGNIYKDWPSNIRLVVTQKSVYEFVRVELFNYRGMSEAQALDKYDNLDLEESFSDLESSPFILDGSTVEIELMSDMI